MNIPGVFKNADTVRDVPAGEVVFEAGAEGNEMYGVIEGEIEVRTPGGSAIRIGPNGTFGEMALIDHTPRSATAVATEDTKLAVINQRMFLFLVHETPMFAIQVMGSLAERLRARG